MQSVRVTFQDGVFRPLEPVNLPDGTAARVEIEDVSGEKPWMRFCGAISKQESDTMSAAIEEAIEQVHPDDWK